MILSVLVSVLIPKLVSALVLVSVVVLGLLLILGVRLVFGVFGNTLKWYGVFGLVLNACGNLHLKKDPRTNSSAHITGGVFTHTSPCLKTNSFSIFVIYTRRPCDLVDNLHTC